MMENNFEIRRTTRWYTHVGDFLNTLKAFMGTNYQALPFAFAMSGLGVGIPGVLIVATLTDHCCQLLVRSKMHIVDKTIRNKLRSGKITDGEVTSLRERLEFALGYGDIGMQVFGLWCYRVIQAAVCFTQFTTCVVYFVFIANTVAMIFPLQRISICNATDINATSEYPHMTSSVPGLVSANNPQSIVPCNCSNELAADLLKNEPLDVEFYQQANTRQSEHHQEIDSNGVWSSKNETPPCDSHDVQTSPDLRLIVLFPLPIFILTSLVRNVRYLAPLSSIATVAMGVGAVAVLSFLISGFHVGPFDWYKIYTLPLFFCQLISAYEGIGCILPIQSSMVGCRHLFPRYLHANIYLIFLILCSFGTLGYLRYGGKVQQIIVLEITQHTIMSILVDITLIISVLFTFPLQCYPTLEIIEVYILKRGRPLKLISVQDPEVNEQQSENEPLMRSHSFELSVSEVENAMVGPEVPTWKRNIIRITVTLVMAGLAVILRDSFAYVASFSGAVGCSLLAFILPCLFDLQLRYHEMSWIVRIKNICIIVFSVTISILGLTVIILTTVNGKHPV